MRSPRQVSFVFLLFISLSSCYDKHGDKQKEIKVNGRKYQVSVTSSSEWDAGVAGGGHAPIFIPYVKKDINNSVQITNDSGCGIIVDDITDHTEFLKEDEMNEVVSSIELKASPDNHALLYYRKGNRSTARLIHQLDNGHLFWIGKYDSLVTAQCWPDKEPDWSIVPSIESVIGNFLTDTVYYSTSMMVIEALLTLPHPNGIDDVALENFGHKPNSTAYMKMLVIDSGAMNSNVSWKAEFEDRYRELLVEMKKDLAHHDTTGSLELQHEVFDLALNSELNVMPAYDSAMCELAFMDQMMFYRLMERTEYQGLPELSEGAKQFFLLNFRKYVHARSGAGPRMARDLFDIGSTLSLEEVTDYAEKELIRTWPVMASDDDEPNMLESYYTGFSPEGQKKAYDKAMLELKGKNDSIAVSFLYEVSTCEQLKSLMKKYPGQFKENKTLCDSTAGQY